MIRPRTVMRLLALGVLITLSVGYPRDSRATDWCAGGVCQEWVARYDDPASDADSASAVAVDASGNVYVTGWSIGIPDEETGLDYDEYATVKYDNEGNQLWVARYDNAPGDLYLHENHANALAVDSAGNVYVTGYSNAPGTQQDYTTIKYDSNGNQLWVARYNGPGNQFDAAYAMAVDGAGNVYVTGRSFGGSATWFDYATIKYDNNGNQLWVARYDTPGSDGDNARALAVDSTGNVYVTGGSEGDYATIKYDSNGNQQWVAHYTAGQTSDGGAYAIAVDSALNVYVTGYTGYVNDYATIKYDNNGNQQWVALYDAGSGRDRAQALGIDAAGNAYVTGYSDACFGCKPDYATVKYGPDGSEQWVARYAGPGGLYDWAYSLALDGASNVYVTGSSDGGWLGTSQDYATIKYDSAGNQLWVARYHGPSYDDEANGLAVDSVGNVYVTGYSDGLGTSEDYATIKYSQYPVTPTPTSTFTPTSTMTPTPTNTPTPTATPKPPQAVGGTVKLPAAAIAAESDRESRGTASGVALAGAAAVVTLSAGGWYARRRRRAG